MKYDCEVVQDLLPLYHDQVCSDSSRRMVEEHILECETCKKVAEQIGNGAVEKQLKEEKNNVLKRHQKMVNKKTTTIGITTAGILMVPVIICLICNIAIGHALDWFFIVLTAMLLVASFLVVPFIAETNRLMYVILSATGSLILLLLTCCIYTRGDWFFVAAAGCIFGISLMFAPFVIPVFCNRKNLKRHSAVLIVLWDTVWLYLLLIVCGIYVQGGRMYWQTSMSITSYFLLLAGLFVIVINYSKINGWIKAGILVICTGFWFGFCTDILNFLLKGLYDANGEGLKNLDLSKGFSIENPAVFNANILFTVIVVAVCIGGLLIWKGKREKE